MKLNWGTSLVLALVSFIGFIMFFIVQMLSSEHSQDLVKEAYYHDELMFQQEIDKHNNTNLLESNFKLIASKKGLVVHFSKELEEDQIKGTIKLYRPSNKALDTSFDINLDNLQQLISDEFLLKGRWNVLVDFEYREQYYSYKKEIVW